MISLCLNVFISPAKIIIVYVVVWMEKTCQENIAFSFSPRLVGTSWTQWQRRAALLSGSMIAPPSFQPLQWGAWRQEEGVWLSKPWSEELSFPSKKCCGFVSWWAGDRTSTYRTRKVASSGVDLRKRLSCSYMYVYIPPMYRWYSQAMGFQCSGLPFRMKVLPPHNVRTTHPSSLYHRPLTLINGSYLIQLGWTYISWLVLNSPLYAFCARLSIIALALTLKVFEYGQ